MTLSHRPNSPIVLRPGQKVNATGVLVSHAGPTAGKSTLQKRLYEEGISVLGTDDFYSAFAKRWWDLKGWRRAGHDEMAKLADLSTRRFIALISTSILSKGYFDLILGNIWGTDFVKFAEPSVLSSGLVPLSFFVTPEEIVARSAKRVSEGQGSSAFKLDLAKKWFDDWLRWSSESCQHRFILSEGVYLSDAVDFEPRVKGTPKPVTRGEQIFLDGWYRHYSKKWGTPPVSWKPSVDTAWGQEV